MVTLRQSTSCANDFVVYGLYMAGVTGGAANLVALNNLYSGAGGPCGGAPTVMFAYNITTPTTAGRILTSPVLSLDGKKIAFVESVPGAAAIFHVLTWTAGQGQLNNAVAPTPAQMTSTPFAAVSSTTSSPWVDYAADTDVAYMGADDGNLYKITGVFHGTPALAGAPWPILVSANLHLTAPVLDKARGVVMVGSTNGNLYRIDTTTGAKAALTIGAARTTVSWGRRSWTSPMVQRLS